jgi:hypothetical protein
VAPSKQTDVLAVEGPVALIMIVKWEPFTLPCQHHPSSHLNSFQPVSLRLFLTNTHESQTQTAQCSEGKRDDNCSYALSGSLWMSSSQILEQISLQQNTVTFTTNSEGKSSDGSVRRNCTSASCTSVLTPSVEILAPWRSETNCFCLIICLLNCANYVTNNSASYAIITMSFYIFQVTLSRLDVASLLYFMPSHHTAGYFAHENLVTSSSSSSSSSYSH